MNPYPPIQPPAGHPPSQGRAMSRVVPIVVSAGLAIGVFCGLLFGVGTGGASVPADPTPAPGNPAELSGPAPTAPQPPPADRVPAPPPPTAKSTLPTTTPTTASTPPVAAGSGSSAVAAAPARRVAKITVELKPSELIGKASIKIDGKAITDNSADVELGPTGKKQVKLVIKASGYNTVEQKLDVDDDLTVQFELVKRSGLKRPPPPGDKPPGGGLIDI
ncbi:MAG: hypothetical protein AB7O24_23305 [Kofleriaceae bacterium]